MDWPSNSPDLNPIENLWGWMAREVYKNGRQFNSLNELKNEVEDCWERIHDSVLQDLAMSLPNRIFELVKANGGSTKY